MDTTYLVWYFHCITTTFPRFIFSYWWRLNWNWTQWRHSKLAKMKAKRFIRLVSERTIKKETAILASPVKALEIMNENLVTQIGDQISLIIMEWWGEIIISKEVLNHNLREVTLVVHILRQMEIRILIKDLNATTFRLAFLPTEDEVGTGSITSFSMRMNCLTLFRCLDCLSINRFTSIPTSSFLYYFTSTW